MTPCVISSQPAGSNEELWHDFALSDSDGLNVIRKNETKQNIRLLLISVGAVLFKTFSRQPPALYLLAHGWWLTTQPGRYLTVPLIIFDKENSFVNRIKTNLSDLMNHSRTVCLRGPASDCSLQMEKQCSDSAFSFFRSHALNCIVMVIINYFVEFWRRQIINAKNCLQKPLPWCLTSMSRW